MSFEEKNFNAINMDTTVTIMDIMIIDSTNGKNLKKKKNQSENQRKGKEVK